MDPRQTSEETPPAIDRLGSQRYVPAIKVNQTTSVNGSVEKVGAANIEAPSGSPVPAVQASERLQRQAYELYMNSAMNIPTIRDDFTHLHVQSPPSAHTQVNSEGPIPRMKNPVDEAPVPSSFPAPESFFAELASISAHQSASPDNVDHSLNIHGSYSVFCNECDHAIPGAHYHCSICDDGDFDLCQSCVDSGVLCGGEGHWLIKRTVRDGKVINSTTETIPPKAVKVENEKEVPGAFTSEVKEDDGIEFETRTCNSCVGGKLDSFVALPCKTDCKHAVFPESKFVTCTYCEDYDLCLPCLVGMKHGHHPSHEFKSATDETPLSAAATRLCSPGRNMLHFAVCDGCDKVCISLDDEDFMYNH